MLSFFLYNRKAKMQLIMLSKTFLYIQKYFNLCVSFAPYSRKLKEGRNTDKFFFRKIFRLLAQKDRNSKIHYNIQKIEFVNVSIVLRMCKFGLK
jgi:hypothetical protein